MISCRVVKQLLTVPRLCDPENMYHEDARSFRFILGKDLREKGINRIGNLLVPNDNYCKFEDWIMPIFDTMLEEQKAQGINWTPAKIIHRLGLEIKNEESIYYWTSKNNIPVFSPALTDGSLGDMLYFHSYKNPGLRVDILEGDD